MTKYFSSSSDDIAVDAKLDPMPLNKSIFIAKKNQRMLVYFLLHWDPQLVHIL